MTNSIPVMTKIRRARFMVARSRSRPASSAMFFTLKAALMCLALSAGVSADNQVAVKADQTIVIVGDSLSAAYGIDQSEGWVALLRERLAEELKPVRVNIVNASVSGDTSTDGLDKLPGILERHKPDVVMIELGGNDGLRGQPVSIIRDNIDAMITLGKNAAATVVLIGIRLPPNYGPRYVGEFEAVYSELSARHDVELVPFLLEGVAGNAQLMQADGIHPLAPAQPIIVENVWPILIKVLTKVTKKAEN